MKNYYIKHILILLFIVSLLFGGCGKANATTMRLERTEGMVNVTDSDGNPMTPTENLMLYSGYGMETDIGSYAWINLDDVKLTKMDEKSEIEVRKTQNQLELLVNSGRLFFNITEPLTDEESMNIETSSMTVGIRGTCGWVDISDESHARCYILEGTVRVTATDTDETVSISGGEVAEVRLNAAGEVELIVTPFTPNEIPNFIMRELIEDEPLQAKILDASAMDIHSAAEARRASLDAPVSAETYKFPEEANKFLGTYVNGEYYIELIRNEENIEVILWERDDEGAIGIGIIEPCRVDGNKLIIVYFSPDSTYYDAHTFTLNADGSLTAMLEGGYTEWNLTYMPNS